MATDNTPPFDLGPLSWVQPEIDRALALGVDALAAFGAAPEDSASLQHARNHVHQAAGAIRMVGLDGVVAFTDEIERQLARVEELPPADAPAVCAVVERACRKLRIFLGEVVGGAPPVTLILFPEYDSMQRSRGVAGTAPADLFYPDLGVRAPGAGSARSISGAALASHLLKQRRSYQQGLLAFLRGDAEGARAMRAAASGIERASEQASLRTFWWTVGALFDALAGGGLEASFAVKQLAGRIDLQIRRVVTGSAKVADRLRREVLYFLAVSEPVAPSVQDVQDAFRLAELVPPADVLNADLVRLQPLLRDARERLASAKDVWLKVTSGRAENLPKLKEALASVHASAVDIGNPALVRLTGALASRLDGVPPSGGVPESLAMEYATGMLLAESAVENYAGLSKEFPRQVDAMLARLEAAQSAPPFVPGTAPLLDEMSRRAQERLLLAQVGREIQANLRHMEQVLDAFFRDHAKRTELATLIRDSEQIRGALKMLGLDDAERLLGSCQAQIVAYADPDAPVDDLDLELLAESLSGLGFYVEAVEQQRPERERLLAPLLAKRFGGAPRTAEAAGETVEAAVEELRNALPALVEEMHRAPVDAAAREALRARLRDLADDAKLIDDADLVAQAEAALCELDRGGEAALEAAVTAIAGGTATPAPAVSDETQRLLATDATGLDAELVGIYLAEAAEVLDTVSAQLAVLHANFGDRDALRTVRRQFHTLKGSGRMVGLTELGEIAYDVERIHNRLLEEEHPVTPTVLAMIALAERDFRHWIGELNDAGRVIADPAQLHAAIRAVESELPATRESVLERPAVGGTPVERAKEGAPEAPRAPAELPELGSVEALQAPEVEPAGEEVEAFDVLEVGHDDAFPLAADALPIMAEAAVEATADEIAPTRAIAADADADAVTVSAVEAFGNDAATAELAKGVRATDETAGGGIAADDVTVGDVVVPADLFAIVVDEAAGHLDTLVHGLSRLGSDPQHLPSAAMVRASHTLCGIHRTAGFPLIATAAKALEQCLVAMGQADPAMRVPVLPLLDQAIGCLGRLVGRVRTREGFSADDISEAGEIGSELDSLRQRLAVAAETAAEVAAEKCAATSEPLSASFTEVLDEVDEELLPIFLEEAAELFPQAGEQLRTWRRAPSDMAAAAQLRRTLHTFKGSARMAGALRLGELAHLMESRFVGDDMLAAGTTELFEALDTDLDHVAFVLDALREGRANVALPWLARPTAADGSVEASDVLSAVPIAKQEPSAASTGIELPLEPEATAGSGMSAGIEMVEEASASVGRAESDEIAPLEAITAQRPAMLVDATMPAAAAAFDEPAARDEPVGAEEPVAAGEVPAIAEPVAADEVPAIAEPVAADEAIAVGEPVAIGGEPATADEALAITEPVAEDEAVTVDEPVPTHEAFAIGEPAAADEALARGEPVAADEPLAVDEAVGVDEPAAEPAPAFAAELSAPTEAVVAAESEPASTTEPVALGEPAADAGSAPLAEPVVASEPEAIAAPAAERPVVVPLPSHVLAATPRMTAGEGSEAEPGARAMLRVRADIVDRLANEAGEVAIARARIESELRALKANLLELTASVIRLRSQVREVEIQSESQIQSRMSQTGTAAEGFDPLEFDRFTQFQELTRSLAEGVNDVSTVQQALLKNLDDADAALAAQARLSREVQQQLFAIRTVPFGSIAERLYRTLRATAKELDKRVNLDLRGGSTELDRSVLEKLVGPLEHLLRNAVDHGIEPREARARAGKPRTGEIVLTVEHVGNEIAIELTDDGGGLNLDDIRAKGVASGRFSATDRPTDAQLVECIFEPGFSTASRVTQVSGRGIGMDVVRAEIAALGGRIEVTSRPGRGTTFMLYLPLTLAVAQVVLVRAAGRLWAMPGAMVEQVQQVKGESLADLYAAHRVDWQGRSYPLYYLPRLLGDEASMPEVARNNPVLLLRAGNQLAAVHVDEMAGNQEVVVKNIGPQLARVSGIAGATVLGTGEIVLIVNAVQLAQRADIPGFDESAVRIDRAATGPRAPRARLRPLVMIVDDSLTVRKITSRMLTREGFKVAVAKDGVDALELLEAELPDAILLDIEMPRMDGFEFAKTVKGDPRTAGIPIVMITSRVAEKHRNRALALGVERYLGKPYQEDELLRNLNELLAVTA